MGRSMTLDWSGKPQGAPYAKFGDPQSLNLYPYMKGNPLEGMRFKADLAIQTRHLREGARVKLSIAPKPE
jgi:hypothetical protein